MDSRAFARAFASSTCFRYAMVWSMLGREEGFRQHRPPRIGVRARPTAYLESSQDSRIGVKHLGSPSRARLELRRSLPGRRVPH